jgi:hypothetical protein
MENPVHAEGKLFTIEGILITVLWNIWHISRIEDIAGNILIHNGETIFSQLPHA